MSEERIAEVVRAFIGATPAQRERMLETATRLANEKTAKQDAKQ